MSNPPLFPGNQPPQGEPGQPQPNPPQTSTGPQGPQQQFGGYQQPQPQHGDHQGPGQPFGGQQPPNRKTGMSTGAKVAIALMVLFFAIIGGCIAMVAVVGNSLSNVAGEFAEEARRNTLLLEENSEIIECEQDGAEAVRATVEVTSPFEDIKNVVIVEVNFLEGSNVIGSGAVTLSDLAPKQSAVGEVVVLGVADETIDLTCEIANISGF